MRDQPARACLEALWNTLVWNLVKEGEGLFSERKMGGTMGESTRKRMQAAIQGGSPGNLGGTRGSPGAVYVGGYAGGMAGTFGKASRGLGNDPTQPQQGGAQTR